MEYENTEFDDMREIIKEQAGILNEMRETKAYRAVEGYHFLKAQRGVQKIQTAGKVLKHIGGRPNKKIQIQDPMEAVLKLQADMGRQLDILEQEMRISQECLQVPLKIQQEKERGRGVISVFAPFQIMNLPDGYSRRVKNVDDLLGNDMLRIYIAQDGEISSRWPICRFEREHYISVAYNNAIPEHCDFVFMVTRLTGIAYVHSAFQALSLVSKDAGVIKLYDFHGVVPEELILMGLDKEADYYSQKESELVQNADYIITANQAMQDHIIMKYPNCTARFITMPMNNDDNNQEENFIIDMNKKEDQKPIVIYSGGLQKWQLIPEMQDAICKERNECEFHIYVSDPDEFMRYWGDREAPDDWEITTKTAEEMKEVYRHAQYGFVLRDDIVVNNVACPTKIIDYIKYDIIPIVKSPHIGDFERYGMEYLSLEDFLQNRFPSSERRMQMCRKNREIIGKILEEYKSGRDIVERIILEKCFI